MAAPVTGMQLMNALAGLMHGNLLFASAIFVRPAWDVPHPSNTSLDPECTLVARDVSLYQGWSVIFFFSSNVIALAFATKQSWIVWVPVLCWACARDSGFARDSRLLEEVDRLSYVPESVEVDHDGKQSMKQ